MRVRWSGARRVLTRGLDGAARDIVSCGTALGAIRLDIEDALKGGSEVGGGCDRTRVAGFGNAGRRGAIGAQFPFAP
jgi:hypothetical protein